MFEFTIEQKFTIKCDSSHTQENLENINSKSMLMILIKKKDKINKLTLFDSQGSFSFGFVVDAVAAVGVVEIRLDFEMSQPVLSNS